MQKNSNPVYKSNISTLVSWGHWFAFLNTIFTLIIGSTYILDSMSSTNLIGQIYLWINLIGQFGFLTFATYILFIFPITFILRNDKALYFYSVLIATCGISVLIIDAIVYKNMHLHLNMVIWDIADIKESFILKNKWLTIIIIAPLAFIAELYIAKLTIKYQRAMSRKRKGMHIAFLFALCFLSSHLMYIWADANLYRPIITQRSNLPLSYPMTAKTFMEKHGLFNRAAYIKRLQNLDKPKKDLVNYPLKNISFKQVKPKYNILFVMVDSLRYDSITNNIMPNLNNYALNNINYTNHYSSSNEKLSSLFSLFFGIPANYINDIKSDNKNPLLLTYLKKNNYHLGLFSSDNFSDLVYSQNIFKQESKLPTVSINTKKSFQERDNETIQVWQKWLTNEDTNKNLWFSFIELNGPLYYEQAKYPQSFKVNNSPNSPIEANKSLIAKYKNAVIYQDKLIAKIIDHLNANNLQEKTIVIITSDHGMEFNETKTNSWGFNSNYSDFQLKVPLIIHWPENNKQKVENLTSHLDIVPTLFENLLYTTTPAKNYSSGKNLFSQSKHDWLLAGDSIDIVVIDNKNTLVIDKFGNYQLFDKKYKNIDNSKTKLSQVLQAISEIKRFYNKSY